MYCKNCGQPVKDNDRFCKNCGAELRFQQTDDFVVHSKNKAETKRELLQSEKTIIVFTIATLALTLFPFHNIIVVLGTILGIVSFLWAAIKRDHINGQIIRILMTLSFTAIIIHMAWFAFINIIL
ncbi:MAG: zinc-ribbon domain-containing protein [Bacilli bacterium]